MEEALHSLSLSPRLPWGGEGGALGAWQSVLDVGMAPATSLLAFGQA